MQGKRDHVSERRINQFIIDLGRYAKKSGNQVVAVFDGGPDIYPIREKEHGIIVVYSGQREHADDLIKRYLDTHKGEDILLVSTDRELDGYAQKLGLEYIDSYDFYQLMQERLAGVVEQETQLLDDDVLYKISEISDTDLDALMEAGSEKVMLKDEESERSRESKRHKMSKKDRQRLSKLKKI